MRCTTESTPFRAADNSARRDDQKSLSGWRRDRRSRFAVDRASPISLTHRARRFVTAGRKQQQFMTVNNSASFRQQIALKSRV